MVQHAVTEAPGEEDNDDDDDAEATGLRPDALPSSIRRRINAWLPLYINEANWSISKTFAPSAFSLIATQLNAAFQPNDALKVLPDSCAVPLWASCIQQRNQNARKF